MSGAVMQRLMCFHQILGRLNTQLHRYACVGLTRAGRDTDARDASPFSLIPLVDLVAVPFPVSPSADSGALDGSDGGSCEKLRIFCESIEILFNDIMIFLGTAFAK
jgi:hypothetical protein